MTIDKEFWKHKSLAAMTNDEWEALCDGCGFCCLYKIEDADTGEILLTHVACRFLDLHSVTCKLYKNRFNAMPTCIKLTPAKVEALDWLPDSCAYRLVLQGKPLPAWHPLVSGNPDSIHQSSHSIQGKAQQESDVNMDHLEDYIIDDAVCIKPQKKP